MTVITLSFSKPNDYNPTGRHCSICGPILKPCKHFDQLQQLAIQQTVDKDRRKVSRTK